MWFSLLGEYDSYAAMTHCSVDLRLLGEVITSLTREEMRDGTDPQDIGADSGRVDHEFRHFLISVPRVITGRNRPIPAIDR